MSTVSENRKITSRNIIIHSVIKGSLVIIFEKADA